MINSFCKKKENFGLKLRLLTVQAKVRNSDHKSLHKSGFLLLT